MRLKRPVRLVRLDAQDAIFIFPDEEFLSTTMGVEEYPRGIITAVVYLMGYLTPFKLSDFVDGFLKSKRPFVQLFPKYMGGLAESDSHKVG